MAQTTKVQNSYALRTDATDGNTAILARELGIIPEIYLENNNSYNFFKRLDFVSKTRHHLITGPTGTNVMDMQVILVEV